MSKTQQIRTQSNGANGSNGAAKGAAKAGLLKNNPQIQAKSQQSQPKQQQQQKRPIIQDINDVPSLSWLFPEVSSVIAQNAPQIRTVAQMLSSSSQKQLKQSSSNAMDWSLNLGGLSQLFPEVIINTSEHQLRIVGQKKLILKNNSLKQQEQLANPSQKQLQVTKTHHQQQLQQQKPQQKPQQVSNKLSDRDWLSDLSGIAQFFPEITVNTLNKQTRIVSNSQSQNQSQQQKYPQAQNISQLGAGKESQVDWSLNLSGLSNLFPEVQVHTQAHQIRLVSNKQSGIAKPQQQQSGLAKSQQQQNGLAKSQQQQNGIAKSLQSSSASRTQNSQLKSISITQQKSQSNAIQNLIQNSLAVKNQTHSSIERDRELEEISWLFPENFSGISDGSRLPLVGKDNRNQRFDISKGLEYVDNIHFEGDSNHLRGGHKLSSSQFNDWVVHNGSLGAGSLKLKSLGMQYGHSILQSMSSLYNSQRNAGTLNSSSLSYCGNGNHISNWRDLISALNSMIILANSQALCYGRGSSYSEMKSLSQMGIQKGKFGLFSRIDYDMSSLVISPILVGTSSNFRVHISDCLEEAIGWRKHVMDRG